MIVSTVIIMESTVLGGRPSSYNSEQEGGFKI